MPSFKDYSAPEIKTAFGSLIAFFTGHPTRASSDYVTFQKYGYEADADHPGYDGGIIVTFNTVQADIQCDSGYNIANIMGYQLALAGFENVISDKEGQKDALLQIVIPDTRESFEQLGIVKQSAVEYVAATILMDGLARAQSLFKERGDYDAAIQRCGIVGLTGKSATIEDDSVNSIPAYQAKFDGNHVKTICGFAGAIEETRNQRFEFINAISAGDKPDEDFYPIDEAVEVMNAAWEDAQEVAKCAPDQGAALANIIRMVNSVQASGSTASPA